MKQLQVKKKKVVPSISTFEPRIPSFLIYVFFVFWVYLVASNYYRNNPVYLQYLSHIFSLRNYPVLSNPNYFGAITNFISHIFFLLLILVAGYGLGEKVSQLFKYKRNSILENFLFSVGLGLGAIIFFIFAIGICGLLYKNVVLFFLLIFGLLGLWEIKKNFRPSVFVPKGKFTVFEISLVIILFLTSLLYLIGALAPDIYYDSMVYYLGVPNYWIVNHKITVVPFNCLSQHPYNISLLYTVGLLLKDDILAKLIHFSLGVLTLITIYVFCRKYFNRQIGLLAAVIFYTIPVVGMVSQRAGIELGLAFFETLAVFAFINWCQTDNRPITPAFAEASAGRRSLSHSVTQSPSHPITSHKWLIISGIFAGLAMGGKYTSVICAIGLFIIIIFKVLYFDKEGISKALRNAFLFGTICTLVLLPWLIKNTINTGNPVFPFFCDFMGHVKLRDPIPLEGCAMRPKNIFLFPWTVTMGQDTKEPIPGPIFLLTLPFLFLFGKPDKITKLLLFYSSILYIFWAFWICYLRYFIPSLPIISVILAIYISKVTVLQIFKKVILSVTSLVFLGNIYFILLMQKLNQNPLPFVLGLESKEEFLFTQRGGYPNPYYGVINWANQNLPETVRILFLGETRGLYTERQIVFSFVNDWTHIVEYSRLSKNGDELAEKLRREKITHILLNVPEAKRLACYDMLYWEGEDLRVFLEFWNKYVKEIYKDIADISIPHQGIYSMKKQVPNWWYHYALDPRNYVYLYEILSPKEAEKSHPNPPNFFFMPEIYPQYRWEKIKNYFHLSG